MRGIMPIIGRPLGSGYYPVALNSNEKKLAGVLKEITANAAQSKNEGVVNAFKILERTQTDVVRSIKNATTGGLTEGQITRLSQLNSAIDRATLNFGIKYKAELSSGMDDLWDIGQLLVDNPLDVMGVSVQVPELNVRALEAAEKSMRRLVDNKQKGIVAGLNDSIKKSIESGIAGQKTPFEIIAEIGLEITDPGPFISTAKRAETVFRTETGSIQNIATSDRLTQSASHVPGLGHQWWWSGIGRVEHAIANGQIRPVGVPFDVGGEKLLYPLDPAGSAKNTINCGCSETATREGWPSLQELNPTLSKKAELFTKPIAEALAGPGANRILTYHYSDKKQGFSGHHPQCYGELLIHQMVAATRRHLL